MYACYHLQTRRYTQLLSISYTLECKTVSYPLLYTPCLPQELNTCKQSAYTHLHGRKTFNWHSECIHAFDELKSRLLSAPILSFPDFEKPFFLDTDACHAVYGIGAVLSQDHDGEEKVVAYGSRTLSKAERKYCVTRKELLAVVTFTKHFRPYLLGRHFTLRTEHSSLQWLYNMKEPEGQLARWLEQLQEYDIAVIHRRGCNHGNADALSRIGPDENEANITGGSSSKDMGVSAVQPQRLQTGTGDAKSMRQLQLEG